MYKILSNQKKRVMEGKYSRESYLFLVDQAYSKKKITKAECEELKVFE